MPPNFDDLEILDGDIKQLNALFQAVSTAPLTLRVNTAEKFFARLFSREPMASREQLDAAFVPILNTLKAAFVTLSSHDDSFYCQASHPLRQIFDSLLTRATTWYTRDSKPNEMFYDKFSSLANLATQWCSQPANTSADSATDETIALQNALFAFKIWDLAEEKRAALVESRLCESELNNLRMLTAECQVLDVINHALVGKNIPTSLFDGISTTLKNELQHCAFTSGIDSAFWAFWKRILPLIANVFTYCETEQYDQEMYRDVPRILGELERSLNLNVSQPEPYNVFIETLNNALILAVQKQPQTCGPLPQLLYPEGHSTIQMRVTDSVLQQTANIQVGNWFLFSNEDNKNIRCKLALKNSEIDQLLFVDRAGRKVMIKSTKDFSMCISTGIARPLLPINLMEIISKLIQALITLHKNNPTDASVTIEDIASPEQQTLSENLTHDINNEVSLRKASAHKAMAEARALADEKARRAAETLKKQQDELEREKETLEEHNLERRNGVLQQINELNVGAWVEISIDAQHKQRCKLAVIIASIGKYIFVDSLGRKVIEYNQEEIVRALSNNHLTLINNGDKFEDQLAKVIRSLRKDIH